MSNSTSPTVAQDALRERVETALEAIRPALQSDGGDVEYVSFSPEDGLLQLRLVGACGACPISWMTVRHGIERRVKASIPEVLEVQAI